MTIRRRREAKDLAPPAVQTSFVHDRVH